MILKSLHIISFGGLINRDIDLSPGVNVIEGGNESGKSSAAMFIKFIFYGLSSKSGRNTGPSERQRYVNTHTGQAAGYILAETDAGKLYRLERALITSDNAPPRERVRIIDQSTGDIITGQNPGEYFFGVSADVFVNTCFLSQARDPKPEIASFGQSSKGSVIGNLLTSADENTDISHALDKLDAVRRNLLHRNKNGGEISALREKRGALLAEMKSSTDRAAEIITVSTSLDDITRRIAELEEADAHYTELFAAAEKINLKKRADSAAHAKQRAEELSASLAKLDASPLGEGFEEAVLEAEREIRAYDELCAAYDELIERIDVTEEEDIPEADDVIAEVQNTDSAARIQFSAAIALLLSGIIGLAASFILYFFNTDLYMLPLLITLILITLGVLFIIRHAGTRKKLDALLDEWNAESASEIETAVTEKLSVMSVRRALTVEKENMEALLGTAKLRFDTAEERLNALAEAANLQKSDDIYETAANLSKIGEGISSERRRISEKIAHYHGKLSALNEQLDGVDTAAAELEAYTVLETPVGKEADSMSAEELKKAAAERDFTSNALKSAMKRKISLEEKLAELGKLNHTPDECATMLSSLDSHIEELTLRHDACELAEKAIRAAGDTVQSGVIPRIAQDASVLLRGASPHENIILDSSFGCGASTDGKIISNEHLSRGTADLIYTTLRIALSREIIRGETPILVIDEGLSHIDPDRVKGLIRQLTDGQYLIFTCRRDEAEIAEKLGCVSVKMNV